MLRLIYIAGVLPMQGISLIHSYGPKSNAYRKLQCQVLPRALTPKGLHPDVQMRFQSPGVERFHTGALLDLGVVARSGAFNETSG